MTGLHGGHTPIRSNPGGVPILPGETTVADLLKPAGYTSGLFGKWGLGDIGTEGVPWKHGFDEFYGFLHQAHAHFQYPRFLYHNDKESPLAGNSDSQRTTYANDAMADKAVEFIRRQKGKPFFLYYSPTIPHFEPHVPEDSMREYRGKFPMGKPWGEKNPRLKSQPDLRTAYAGMVSRVDRYVGRIMKELAAHNLDRDTIVFFTSDNGGQLPSVGEAFFSSMGQCRGGKGTMYEGGIRVPLIARAPGRIAANRRSMFQWYFADFLPTACEFAGVKKLPTIDGISVVPTLLGGKQTPHKYLYWEQPRYNSKTQEFLPGIPMQGVRAGNWKAVRPAQDGPVEIYDLDADPSETKDLAAVNKDQLTRLTAMLKEAHVPPRPQKEPPHPWWEARS
jgi:arylsulfatase A-like enzyme